MKGRGDNKKLKNDTRAAFERFQIENGHYPTAQEIDACSYMTSARQIQRKFGGVVALRRDFGLPDEDLTKGDHSSKRATMINARAHRVEAEVYEFLKKKFGVEYVHREYFFTDDSRTRTDFYIYYDDGTFSVDVFYPASRHNLLGCLSSKMRTYRGAMVQYPVIFLQMNPDIDQAMLDGVVARKRDKLHPNQSLMTFGIFKKYCLDKKAR